MTAGVRKKISESLYLLLRNIPASEGVPNRAIFLLIGGAFMREMGKAEGDGWTVERALLLYILSKIFQVFRQDYEKQVNMNVSGALELGAIILRLMNVKQIRQLRKKLEFFLNGGGQRAVMARKKNKWHRILSCHGIFRLLNIKLMG